MNKLYINGEEYRCQTNWSITEKSGNPSQSSFTVWLTDGQRIPQSNDLVEFQSNGTTLFRGICSIPKGQAFSTGNELRIYTLSCNSANSILGRRLPNVSYADKTLSWVVNKLYTDYIAFEGFTLGRIEVTNEPTFDIYNSNQIGLDKLLNELAEYVGAVWEITADKVFNFYSAMDEPAREVTLGVDNAGLSALNRSDTSNGIRTRQIIEGCTSQTSVQTENYIYDPNAKTVVTIYPLALQPTIKINGVEVPNSEVAVRNLAAEEHSVLFFWTYESENISVNPAYTGSTSLPSGATITVLYTGIIDIRMEVDNLSKMQELASKTGTSGIIENYYSDKTLKTPADAYAKANALLLTHGDDKRTLTANTTTEILTQCQLTLADTAIGTLWHFNLPDFNITGDYVITERTLKQNIQAEDESYQISIKWADKDLSGGYATTLSDIEKNQTRMSVRENLKIIKYADSSETTGLQEELKPCSIIQQFVCVDLDNGQIATPCGTLYPYITV